jgi:type II secretory pathway pseudopilin PulG
MRVLIFKELKGKSLNYLNQKSCRKKNHVENQFIDFNSRMLKETIKPISSHGCCDLKQKRTGASSGFSLIETLISMAIVFFLLVGTAQMLCYSLLLKQKADTHRIAADLISKKLETLKSLRPDDSLLAPGIHQETTKDQNSDRHFLLSWEVDSSGDRLKKISLSISQTLYAGKPVLKVIFYISNSLEF